MLTVSALGRRLDTFFSRPFWLCSSKATILCSRRSLNSSCLSKNVFNCCRIPAGKLSPAPSLGLSLPLADCNNGSRARLILVLSFSPLDLVGTIGVLELFADESSSDLSLKDGVVSKFVDILVFLGVTVVVFTLEGDGRVWDRVARGALGMDADNLVGLPFGSLKFCVSFTLRLLAWSGVFLAISKNQLREKSVLFLLREYSTTEAKNGKKMALKV